MLGSKRPKKLLSLVLQAVQEMVTLQRCKNIGGKKGEPKLQGAPEGSRTSLQESINISSLIMYVIPQDILRARKAGRF